MTQSARTGAYAASSLDKFWEYNGEPGQISQSVPGVQPRGKRGSAILGPAQLVPGGASEALASSGLGHSWAAEQGGEQNFPATPGSVTLISPGRQGAKLGSP